MTLHLKVIVIIIFTILLSFGLVRSVPAIGVQQPLIVAMESTGAQAEEFSINGWVKLPAIQLNDEQLINLVGQVMAELKVNPLDYQIIHEEKKTQQSVLAEMVKPNLHIRATVQVVPSAIASSEKEYYLILIIEEKGEDYSSLPYLEKEIQGIMEKFHSSPHISTCLIGWLNGTLRDGKQQELLEKSFSVIDGQIIDKLVAEHFISYTGYTTGIREWLQVGKEKINLNMAMRYSQYDDRTYVTIGSPIITREY